MKHLALLFFLGLSGPSLAASSTSSSIEGVVLDGRGVPRAGVLVHALNPATGFDRTTPTNEKGRFHFNGMRPGETYRIEALNQHQDVQTELNVNSFVRMEG